MHTVLSDPWKNKAEAALKRAETLCFWVASLIYVLVVYALYHFLSVFPAITYQWGDLVAQIAWIPPLVIAAWIKIKLSDWISGDL